MKAILFILKLLFEDKLRDYHPDNKENLSYVLERRILSLTDIGPQGDFV